MKTRLLALSLTFLASAGLWPADCPAASLWTPTSRGLISDHRAASVGDIITILVVQKSTTSHRAGHETEKKLDVEGGPGSGLLDFFPALGIETSRATSGSGATTQSTSLIDRVSGRVVGVTPEGNLEIQAIRNLKLNRDELRLTISGLVRPQDVGPDNTVLSTQIADCRMEWSGRGPIPEKQRPGLLSALLSLLW
jgi:flagellar L-ring protein precursor FlgH